MASTTQLVGFRIEWGEGFVTPDERESVEDLLNQTIYAAAGFTEKRASERHGHPVRVEVESTRL